MKLADKQIKLQESGLGSIYVDEHVVKVVTNVVTKEVDGVHSLTGKLVDVFDSKKRGVSLSTSGDTLHVEVSVVVVYGHQVLQVAQLVQQAVLDELKTNFNLSNVVVDVVVRDVSLLEKDISLVEEE